jgi:NAD(P)-dependent dehydrogenase (short-subunit alcohol dehydrogenase family)
VGKLQGKVAVITGATAGIGFAAADLFVKEGAYVFITGRRQKELDQAVKTIGKNVAGVQGDVAKPADLDRLYDAIKEGASAAGRRRLDHSHGVRRERQRYAWLLGLRCDQGGHTEFRARMDLGTEEIAKAALYLASDDSSFVAGIELFVDGGRGQI